MGVKAGEKYPFYSKSFRTISLAFSIPKTVGAAGGEGVDGAVTLPTESTINDRVDGGGTGKRSTHFELLVVLQYVNAPRPN